MDNNLKMKLYNSGLELAVYVVAFAAYLVTIFFIPFDIDFIGCTILGALVGFTVSLPLLRLVEKHKRK